MKRFSPTGLCVIAISLSAYSQSDWHPFVNTPTVNGKHDDVFFCNPSLGWLVTAVGEVYKTEDGGESWQQKYLESGVRFRCVGFADPLRGWIGKFQLKAPDVYAVYHTTDGGETWSAVKNIPDPKPQGLCGLWTSFDPVIYGCGRYAGPPIFIKSSDGGATWTSKDLSAYASMLIDCYFFSPDSGFIVGGTSAHGVVLFTGDGGETWSTRKVTNHNSEWCWKISFPTRNIGYVSIQTFQDSVFFLKTTDGGVTWQEKFFLAGGTYSPQGIGFINPTVGWMGAYPSFGSSRSELTYKTTDGGETWAVAPGTRNINRIRFLNDSIGFAVGNTVYSYSAGTTSAIFSDVNRADRFSLRQSYPNPFNPPAHIPFTISRFGMVYLKIFDVLGREVATLVNEELMPGNYDVPFDASRCPSGYYFYKLEVGGSVEVRKMALVR